MKLKGVNSGKVLMVVPGVVCTLCKNHLLQALGEFLLETEECQLLGEKAM